MATEQSSSATPVPQTTPDEMRGLAARLRARAQSVLLRHQPEQHRDLGTAASPIEQLANLSPEILTATAVADALACLLGTMGGA